MNRAGTNFSTRIVGNLRKSPFLQTLPDQQCDRTSLLDRNWFVPGYADYRDSVHGATVWSQWSGPNGTNGHTVLHIQYHSIQAHVGYYLSDVNISSGEPGDGRGFFVPARVP